MTRFAHGATNGVAGSRLAHGFTLLELLVTVAIVGIAASIAMPSYQAFVQDAGVSSQANQLLASLNYTRSEAVKRNARVTMCKSSNGTSCLAGTGDWTVGWIIFVDNATVGTVDGGDTLLRVQGAIPGGTSVIGDGSVVNYVSYISNGQTRMADGSAQVGTFSVCSPSPKVKRRKIALTQGTGWVGVSIVAGSATCGS